MSREYTQQEIQNEFLNNIRGMVDTWSQADMSDKGKLLGLAFSILAMIDGTTPGFPQIELVLNPHPDDKQYRTKQGLNYYPEGATIAVDDSLHDLWHKRGFAVNETAK